MEMPVGGKRCEQQSHRIRSQCTKERSAQLVTRLVIPPSQCRQLKSRQGKDSWGVRARTIRPRRRIRGSGVRPKQRRVADARIADPNSNFVMNAPRLWL